MPTRHDSVVTDRTRRLIAKAAKVITTAKTRGEQYVAKDARDEVIRSVYLDGANTHDIVALFAEHGVQISRAQVIRIHSTVQRQEAPKFDLADATKRYRDGASLRDLGRAYGCAPKVVQKALQDAGVEIRGREEAKRIALAAKAEA